MQTNKLETLSILIVSDYAAGAPKGWEDIRKILKALAAQDLSGIEEVLLVENKEAWKSAPPDIAALLPRLKVIQDSAAGSYELKNAGMKAVSSRWAVILDADCTPPLDWVEKLHAAIQAQPGAAVISGRTVYHGRTRDERILSLLSRAFLDPGQTGQAKFISNSQAIWNREVYLRYPLPEGLGPFSSHIQSERMLREGCRLWFDSSLCVVHDFEGWKMERDIRWNIGFGTVITRLKDPAMSYAWLTRLGKFSIPFIGAGKVWLSWMDCFRCARHYGVAQSEIPLAMLYSVRVHLWEAPGMWSAFQGKNLAATAYR